METPQKGFSKYSSFEKTGVETEAKILKNLIDAI
jgi:hypothetical protein